MDNIPNNAGPMTRGGLLLMTLLAGPALAQNYTYNYVGGAAGYAGTIVLDASASPSGGGTLADIVSITVTTPNFGTVTYDPTFAQASGSFVWNSTGISAMNLKWDIAPYPPFSNYAIIFAGVVFDSLQTHEAGVTALDEKGSWIAAPAVPAFNLTISLAHTNAVVSWSTNAVGYQLQLLANPGSNAQWGTVTNIATINSTNYQVTLPLKAGPQLFRLQGS